MALRVLVVDDSAAMRHTIQRAIEISDLPVDSCLTARHGREALSILSDHSVDLLLVDLNMPEMTGDDLIQNLHENPGTARIPFIVMSADATAARIDKLLEMGALTYLPKPFGAETLHLELKKAMEGLDGAN